MTDNFELIKNYMLTEQIPLLSKNAGDLFFSIMLIRRGKDHPNLPSANYTFKSYYIDSIEKLEISKQEIITCCNVFNLRAYVSVNIKSKEAFSKYCSYSYALNVLNNEYKKPWRVLDHVFGKLKASNESRWIVDVDDCEPNSIYLKAIENIINECDSGFEKNCILEVKTKSGMHIITHPFNLQQFNDLCNINNCGVPDVKKDHITLLYENL